MYILTAAEMREADRRTIQDIGVPSNHRATSEMIAQIAGERRDRVHPESVRSDDETDRLEPAARAPQVNGCHRHDEDHDDLTDHEGGESDLAFRVTQVVERKWAARLLGGLGRGAAWKRDEQNEAGGAHGEGGHEKGPDDARKTERAAERARRLEQYGAEHRADRSGPHDPADGTSLALRLVEIRGCVARQAARSIAGAEDEKGERQKREAR